MESPNKNRPELQSLSNSLHNEFLEESRASFTKPATKLKTELKQLLLIASSPNPPPPLHHCQIERVIMVSVNIMPFSCRKRNDPDEVLNVSVLVEEFILHSTRSKEDIAD